MHSPCSQKTHNSQEQQHLPCFALLALACSVCAFAISSCFACTNFASSSSGSTTTICDTYRRRAEQFK